MIGDAFSCIIFFIIQIAGKLDRFLQGSFPGLYESRATETRREEEACDVASPCSDAGACTSTEASGIQSCSVDRIDSEGNGCRGFFGCEHCGKLVFMPVILNCGHMVCLHHETSSHECPCCKAQHPVIGEDRKWHVSMHVWDLIKDAFGEECEERAREVSGVVGVDATMLLMASPRTALLTCPQHADNNNNDDDNNDNERATDDVNVSDSHSAHPRTSINPAVESSGTLQYFATLDALMDWVQKNDFPHFGVGCDVCGQYPILGKRYKCEDCPESVGFDMCGTCFDRNAECDNSLVVGRFNQKHTAQHRMELVPPVITKLHTLKALHPELDFDRLMALIEMSIHQEDSPGDEEDEEMATRSIHSPQSGGDDDDGTMTDGSRMMRARGPRPHSGGNVS